MSWSCLIYCWTKDKRNSLSGTVFYKSSQTHSVVCQPGGQAVMTGLVIQWLLIAAQQQSDSSVC